MRRFTIPAAVCGLAFAGPAMAADPVVTASVPQGIVSLLEIAGYEPRLGTDSYDDPSIHLELGGWAADIAFYGCADETHDGCTELQLIGGFDTNFSVSAETALGIARQSRFAQVYMDDEGDVWVEWDIVTGKGIPQGVFLKGLRNFTDALQFAGGVVFPEDQAQTSAEAAVDAVEQAAQGE
ncbi:MAG: YbjN domain-containing protein [Erythrobacter sp.]|jgi:hypothetical protein